MVLAPRVAQGEKKAIGLPVLTFSPLPASCELILFDFWAMVKLMSTVLSLGQLRRCGPQLALS